MTHVLIPRRAMPKEILTGLALRIAQSGEATSLFPSIKEMAITLVGEAAAPTLRSRFSLYYGTSGDPAQDLNEEVKTRIFTAIRGMQLVPGITADDIAAAFNDAARRLTMPMAKVVPNLIGRVDLNNRQQWERVVLLSADHDHVIQRPVRDAIFKNLIETARKRPTVDLRVFLASKGEAEAYKQALLGTVWADLQAVTPSVQQKDVEGLFKKVFEAGNLEIKARSAQLPVSGAELSVAIMLGPEASVVTNLGPRPLPTDDDALDFWEDLVAALMKLEPLADADNIKHDRKAREASSAMTEHELVF